MTSTKRYAANLRNAQRSSGPKTEQGKRRSSLNATRHGLITPIENSSWAPFLEPLEILLESEGFVQPEARTLALCILNYERSLQYQRQYYTGFSRDGQHKLPEATRHLKRAANQLIKQCKGLISLNPVTCAVSHLIILDD